MTYKFVNWYDRKLCVVSLLMIWFCMCRCYNIWFVNLLRASALLVHPVWGLSLCLFHLLCFCYSDVNSYGLHTIPRRKQHLHTKRPRPSHQGYFGQTPRKNILTNYKILRCHYAKSGGRIFLYVTLCKTDWLEIETFQKKRTTYFAGDYQDGSSHIIIIIHSDINIKT